MIRRATPKSHSKTSMDEQVRLIELIENAVLICDRLGQHRTGALLNDALIAATRKHEER